MIGVNAASHLVTAGLLPVNVPLVVAVSAIAPLVLWRVHRLADEPETPVEPKIGLTVDVIHGENDLGRPAVERVSVPEASTRSSRRLYLPYPSPYLPGRGCFPDDVLRAPPEPSAVPEPSPVPAAEYARTRPEVRAEYVPEPVPDWSVSGTYANERATPRARRDR